MPAALTDLLSSKGVWGLARARHAAAVVIEDPRLAQALVRLLHAKDPVVRRRAADAARRVTEKQAALLREHAERILGAFAESTGDDWRMLAHTGLVAARVAQTGRQQRRAAGLLRPLPQDSEQRGPVYGA